MTHDADWPPQKGVVCGSKAMAALQHAQDANTGPRLQLASSRQRRRGAASSWGAGGAARCARVRIFASLFGLKYYE
jgi:hypothetical protein